MLTVFFQILFSTIQCSVFALITVRDPREWELKLDMGLIAIVYQVIVHCLICQFENGRNKKELVENLTLA